MDKKYIYKSFNAIKSMNYGAKFYKADLHFHTPASEDARGSNKYNCNPYKVKYLKKENTKIYIKSLSITRDKILKDSQKISQGIVNQFIDKNLSLVAITDHNGIGTIWNDDESDNKQMDLAAPTWYELIDDEAQKINKKAGKQLLTILPGIEISTSGIHVLAIFSPQKPRRKIHFIICDLLNEIGFEIDEWGKNPKVGSKSTIDTIELVVKKGGIPILAHIDGSDQSILKLFDLKSGAMKNVLRHPSLSAVEIVDPIKFIKKNRKLKEPISEWIKKLRRKEGLLNFAYFQGSDAHCLSSISKRFTFLKMTTPSFSGFKTAIKIPSSRVRTSEFNPKSDGLFILGLNIENKLLNKQAIRFNRNLNCITGKKGSFKSVMYNLMQSAVNPKTFFKTGKIILFIEKIKKSKSEYYAFYRDKTAAELYKIDPSKKIIRALDIISAKNLGIIPKFYKPEKIEIFIKSEERLNKFLYKHFGDPIKDNACYFNETFSISKFLREDKEKLFEVKLINNTYKLFVNINWQSGKEKMVDFSSISISMRKTVLLCIIIIISKFGPTIINAPEYEFDNNDIENYLIPIIKKYKEQQQIILFTTNPLFSVNTDPDNYILLKTRGEKFVGLSSGFAIDDQANKNLLIEIIEGGLKSFNRRAYIYE